MPRTALPRKACGPRCGDFHTAEQWESNGIFRLSKSLTRLFRQPERTTLCGVALSVCQRTLSRSEKLHSAGGARGGKARLESNRMPRKALPRKACGPRGGDFPTAPQWESNGIFRLRKSLTRLFRQPERAGSSEPARSQHTCGYVQSFPNVGGGARTRFGAPPPKEG